MDDADEEQTPLLKDKIKRLKSKVPRPGKRFWCKCILSSFFAVVVAAIVSCALFGAEQNSNTEGDQNSYTPGDTLVYKNFSTFFCQGLSVGGASIYLVPETPPLTVSPSKVVNYSTPVSISPSEETNWEYLLHKNSSITVNACLKTSQVADDNETYVFIIKGDANYSSYHDDVYFYSSFPDSYIAKVTVDKLCYQGNTTLKFAVEESDNYYISMFNNDHVNDADGIIGWSIIRTEYSIDNFSQPLENCTSDDTYAPCTLFVPFLSTDKVLFVVPGVTSPQDSYMLSTSINCVLGPGAFIIFALSTFMVAVCVCFVFFSFCNWYCCKKTKNFPPPTQGYGHYPPPDPVSTNNYRSTSINNYNSAQVNYYPPPHNPTPYRPPDPAPGNAYPPRNPTPYRPPDPAPGNAYPPRNPTPYRPPDPAPGNAYPPRNPTPYRPPDPARGNAYPPPQPAANNFPTPDPIGRNLPPPQQLPNYPRSDPAPLHNYPPPYSR